MEELTKTEVAIRKHEIMQRIDEGEVFIHPTDTIYGLGCNATDEKAVKQLRKLKERQDAPFSIWAPSKEWITQNCEVKPDMQEWLEKLPGSLTLVLKLKNKSVISKSVNPGTDTIGVRLPDHWFGRVVKEIGIPIVTTSANKTGKPFMTSLEDLDMEIKQGVRFIVYEGEKKGKPSQIVHLIEGGRVQKREK